jgi:hypothetical protein
MKKEDNGSETNFNKQDMVLLTYFTEQAETAGLPQLSTVHATTREQPLPLLNLKLVKSSEVSLPQTGQHQLDGLLITLLGFSNLTTKLNFQLLTHHMPFTQAVTD